MALKTSEDIEETVGKVYPRRPQVVLRTLPPFDFTSPNNAPRFQLAVSVSSAKISQSTPRQLETYPSDGRDFGRGSHEGYAKSEVVKREFERVHERIDEVQKDLKIARDALDQKIAGLETRLTTELQRLEGKIDQLDMKFESRLSQLQLNLDSRLDTHFESIEKRFAEVDDRFNDHFNKIDDRFNEIDQRFDKIEEGIREMKQMLTRLLEGGVVPATPTSPSQAPFPPQSSSPVVVPGSSPVARPSSSPSRRPRPRRSATRRGAAASVTSHGFRVAKAISPCCLPCVLAIRRVVSAAHHNNLSHLNLLVKTSTPAL